jgi:hypothetical protein
MAMWENEIENYYHSLFTIFFMPTPGRFYRVLDRPDVETSSKGGIIRTIYCDLYIENVRRELCLF